MPQQQPEHNLTPEERKRFESLPRQRTAPPYLEEKIMNELQERGLLKTETQGSWNWLTRIAAMLALIVLGGTGGYVLRMSESGSTAPAPKNPLYVLLIRESPKSSGGGQELVAEYGQWAAGVYKSGRYITGEKLRDQGKVLSSSEGTIQVTDAMFNTGQGELGGYFIIEANDYEDAVRIASQCPHLKYGGTIELREIEPT